MSILTLYFDNPNNGNPGTLDTAQPGASTSTTGWTVAKIAAGRYSRMTFGVEVPSGNFTTTAQPSSGPLNSAEDCVRISAATTGDFSAGTWYSSLSVIAVSAGGAQDGRARFRLWRSTSATATDPPGRTEITAGTMIGSNISNIATTVAQSSSASTQIAAFSLSNEYLFMQCAWEITGPGSSNAQDVLVRLGSMAQTNGSGLITADFTATGGAAPVGGMMMIGYYKDLVQELV